MSAFFCEDCNENMVFDHTDYYDFDIYKCPKCGKEFAFPADGYGEPDDYVFSYENEYVNDDSDEYDYTEGDIGQDGEI